jgi:hypothetical protein
MRIGSIAEAKFSSRTDPKKPGVYLVHVEFTFVFQHLLESFNPFKQVV